jgi:hypothetical protein
MLRIIFFNVLLIGSCVYALAKGTRDARIVGATALAASLLTHLATTNHGSIEGMVLAIDLTVLALFVYVALTTDRFWPLWVCGFHLTTMLGHVFRGMSDSFVPLAYAVAIRMWAYPQMIVLVIAVWRSVRRRQREPDIPPVAA